MREIKFRAWDKNVEAMVDPENLHLDGSGLVAVYYQNCDDVESVWETDPAVLNGIILLQYTGLKDKNGKEIYEGDIVRSILPGHPELIKDFIIKWEYDEITGAIGFEVLLCENDREVIGNIYENPELLKT